MAQKEAPRRVLILCFDGTGQTFRGDGSDSNIIKIFKVIDGENPCIYRYYQPGIGTYIEDSALSKSRMAKISSAYKKTMDMMYGTTFDEHIRGGYQFLMQHYEEGADIFIFGFSRGAYTARFLAHMLDCVGLLSAGNEEMFRFAWKAFSQWQSRTESDEKDPEKKEKLFNFMKSFRETFGRPIRRIRFMGLFDTVNSVPRFESKWMSRTKFPYISRSSSKVVRHAVSIDERRAKFRQNLISQRRPNVPAEHHDGTHHLHQAMQYIDQHRLHHHQNGDATENKETEHHDTPERPHLEKRQTFGRFKPRHKAAKLNIPNSPSATSLNSATAGERLAAGVEGVFDQQEDIDEDERAPQDLQEVWFPGCHSDIGGGWPLEVDEEESLSYPPLIWMLREAKKAGLPLDEEALREQGYFLDALEGTGPVHMDPAHPVIEIDGQPVDASDVKRPKGGKKEELSDTERARFLKGLETAATKGISHDALMKNQGTPFGGVFFWNFMEYLPFRRMDLHSDGSWRPIRWPLPFGETRDIPNDAWISIAAIKRMQANPKYRPGNLIIGGGGRGVRVAPPAAGTGHWLIHLGHGDPVGEVFVRDMEAQELRRRETDNFKKDTPNGKS